MDITKNLKDLINRFLLLTITLAFASLLIVGFQLSFTSGIIISMVWMVMVIEDYIYMEVDLRLIGILAFVGLFTTHFSPEEYSFYMLFGLLYFRIVYLAILKIMPNEKREDVQSMLDGSQAFGFLPAIACGLVIYSFYLIDNAWKHPEFLASFFQRSQELYIIFCEAPLTTVLLLLPFIILWIALEIRRHRAEEAGNKIVLPMLGDGDVYVIAVWIGVLGLADMMVVFLISIIVQALVFLYRNILEINYRKGELK